MKIIVFGGAGLLGGAIAAQLRAQGHQVVTAGRANCDVAVDFSYDNTPELFAELVHGVDIVVNAAGILIERGNNTFEAVYVNAPTALFAACATQRVARIVHLSGLGLTDQTAGKYTACKLACERALQACAVDYAIVRPGLVVHDKCPSTLLFKFLAKLPVIALPGLRHPGASSLAPMQVQDVAQAVAHICEHPKALRRTIELAGPQEMTYKEMLQRYRSAAGKGAALWLPMPWWLMKLTARLAVYLPQTVFSVDTMRMLKAGGTTKKNEAHHWLHRMPRPMLEPNTTTPLTLKNAVG